MPRLFIITLVTTILYWAVSHTVATFFGAFGLLPAPTWPAAALALATALLYGPAAIPGIALGAFLANWISIAAPLPISAGIAVMNTVGPLVAATLLRRHAKKSPPFSSLSDVLRFFGFGVVLHAALTATGGIASLVLGGRIPLDDVAGVWIRWWMAHASGTILLAPAVLLWWREKRVGLTGWRWTEAALISSITIFATAAIFLTDWPANTLSVRGLPFLLIAPLAWVSVRFAPRDVAGLLPLVAAIAATGTAMGFGPFASADVASPMLAVGLMAMSYALTTLVLAALAEERRGLERNLLQSVQIIEAARDIVASADKQGRLTYMNAAGRQALGIAEDEDISTLRISDTHPPEAGKLVIDHALPACDKRGFWESENEFLTRDGKLIPVWQIIVAHRNPDGGIEYYSTIARDISQRREAENELRLAASVYHNTVEGIVVTNTDGVILSVNPAFSDITGYSAEEAVGQTPRMLKSDHHGPDFYAEMWRVLKADGRWEGEIWNRRKSGEVFLEWQTITMIPDGEGRPVRYVAVFNDITETRAKDERIRHLAYHDPLTGLPNRQLLHDRLEHAFSVCYREGCTVAVMFLDLDRFKVINDTLGHDVGDNLLREVATRLTEVVRTSDTVARLGGDEFVVVIEQPGSAAAVAAVAEKILRRLAQPVMLGHHVVHVTTSIGIGIFPGDGSGMNEVMKNADTAMYAAKAAGRAGYHFFDASMNDKAQWRLELENEMRQAIDRNEFELFYQPKVSLKTRLPMGAEALIRWRHPVKGLISPVDFIPLAEETGLIVQIGEWVILEVCRQMAQWRKQGIAPMQVAVNVSARQLAGNGVAPLILAALELNELDASALEIELTESAVMHDPEQAIALLTGLRNMGLSIAIDDFGTGYSSLSYLKKLPLNTLKIDRSFIMDVETDEQDAAIVRTIIAMGDTLNLKLVAEGIETHSQAEFLTDCGCALAQGYLFSRPLPADEFALWMHAHTCEPVSSPVIPTERQRAEGSLPARSLGSARDDTVCSVLPANP